MKATLATLAALVVGLASSGFWSLQESGTRARFRGLSVAGRDVAWAGGSLGTCLKTVDGGATWRRLAVSDSDRLDFRDVEAFDDRAAYLLSIGPGELSKILKTVDGGATWAVQHVNKDPRGFLDAIAFWDPDHGLALGDPVDGRYVVLATDDGGRTWAQAPDLGMPPALPGEGAFAASGTCLVVQGTSNAWFGTGGGKSARVFRSTDRGRTWTVADTPIRAGNPSSGVFSLAFRDPDHGLAVGGDYKLADDPAANLAVTADGGKTWTPAGPDRPSGFRSAVAFVPGLGGPAVVAVGPTGSDSSPDGGKTWSNLGPPGFHALGFAGPSGKGWAVGEDGRIARFDPSALKDK